MHCCFVFACRSEVRKQKALQPCPQHHHKNTHKTKHSSNLTSSNLTLRSPARLTHQGHRRHVPFPQASPLWVAAPSCGSSLHRDPSSDHLHYPSNRARPRAVTHMHYFRPPDPLTVTQQHLTQQLDAVGCILSRTWPRLLLVSRIAPTAINADDSSADEPSASSLFVSRSSVRFDANRLFN